MSALRANGIDIYYETAGDGPPLALITGLGFASWSWYRQIPPLSRQFTTIAIDNRGAGQSSKPDEPYSIKAMADDAAAVLRHLDVAGAAIVGVSMGGYIAQELALGHPGLVSRLVLCSTSAGGQDVVMASQETIDTLTREAAADWSPEVMKGTLNLRFSDRCITETPEVIAEYAAGRGDARPPRHGWERQIAACFEFSTGDRLATLSVPTLVITGDDDPIVPHDNSKILADKIPGAELVVIPTGRHLAIIEFADEINEHIMRFCRA